MSNLNGFKFFDFNSTQLISNVLTNPNRGESVTIEVSDDGSSPEISLVVQAKSDLARDNESWHTLAAISLSNYTVNDKITKTGLYQIPISGISKCRIQSEGPLGKFKVYAIMTD